MEAKEIKEDLNPNYALFSDLDDLSVRGDERETLRTNMLTGHTIAETNILVGKATEDIHREAFAKGMSMFYQDERSGTEYYVRANPDGSEDLVSCQLIENNCTVIRQLVPAGKGYWSFLLNS